jgi:DNA-binding beta-propeller fold protein YncE
MRRASIVLGLLAVALAAGQVLEKYIPIPDTLTSIGGVDCLVYNRRLGELCAGDRGVMLIDAAARKREATFAPDGEVMALCLDSAGRELYIATTRQAALVVVDCFSRTTLASITMPSLARELCYNPASGNVYALCPDSQTIVVLDGSTHVVVAVIAVDGWPRAIECNPSTNKLYCAVYESEVGIPAHLVVVDCEMNSIIGYVTLDPGPADICINSHDNRVYCSCGGTAVQPESTIVVVDGLADTVLRRIRVGKQPSSLCYVPELNKVYCLRGWWPLTFDTTLVAIDCDTDSVVGTVAIGTQPGPMCYGSSGSKFYCIDRYRRTVRVVDAVADTLLSIVPVWGDPAAIVDLPGRDEVCVGCSSGDGLTLLSGTGDSVLAVIWVHRGDPTDVCYAGEEDRLFCVAGGTSPMLAVAECDSHTLVATRPLRGSVCHVGYNPASNRVYSMLVDSVIISDAATFEQVASLPLEYYPGTPVHSPGTNKVYCCTPSGSVLVIDGDGDSALARLSFKPGITGLCCNNSGSRVYVSHDSGHVFVLCGYGDSLLRSIDSCGHPSIICYCSRENKIYCADTRLNWIWVLDAGADTFLRYIWLRGHKNLSSMCYNPRDNKVYCSAPGEWPNYDDKVAIVGCAGDSQLSFVAAGPRPGRLLYHPASNKVYCVTGLQLGELTALDGETDSVVGRVFIGKPIRGLAANPRGNYLYACAYLGGVAVISDTTRVGLSASRGTGLTSPVRPALVRGALLIAEQAGATLLDIAGRRVMELKPGENDVRGVAPGVYFVSGPETEDGRPRTAVRKVVIQH